MGDPRVNGNYDLCIARILALESKRLIECVIPC